MNLKVICGGTIGTNCYVLDDILFDYVPEALSYLQQNKIKPQALCLTHIHFDHFEGINELLLAFPELKVYASAVAVKNINNIEYTLNSGDVVDTSRMTPVADGACFEIGTHMLHVIKTPGHSIDSVSWFVEDLHCVFCGDLIFYHSIGRTDFIGGDLSELASSVEKLFRTVSDENVVLYPGHGPSTSVGEEKRANPYL